MFFLFLYQTHFMKKSFLFILFCSSLFYAQTVAQVIAISDGDTITVLLGSNVQQKLRLAEVDCPENGQPFGKNAKHYTSEQVFGKTITFVAIDTDRYGRTIAKVYYDGKYLSEEIIMAGYGWWYHYYSDNDILGEFEQQARHEKKGLWQDPAAIAPWDYRNQNRKK